MNKYQLYALGGALLAAASLVACTSTGRFTTNSAQIDAKVTLNRVCTGIKGMDAIVKGAAAGGLVDARGLAIEQKALALVENFCDPAKPPTDVAGAIVALSGAMVDVGDLIATINK